MRPLPSEELSRRLNWLGFIFSSLLLTFFLISVLVLLGN